MTAVGLGTWRSPAGEVESAVYEALRVGYRHIDCARVYANEAEVGRAIARAIKDGLVKREDLHVTSKVWNNAHSAENTLKDVRASLRDLQLDFLDLVLIHWPVDFKYIEGGSMFPRNEDNTVIHEEDKSVASIQICYQALEAAQAQGLTKAIGVSNFTQEQMEELATYAKVPPAALQIEVHPYFPQNDLLAYCRARQIVVEGYCPLGNLKNPGQEDVTPLNEPLVAEIGKKYGKTPAQVILRWGVQHTGVILPKSVTASRIAENLQLFDFSLTDDDMARMAELGKKQLRFCNPNFAGKDGSKIFKD